MTRLLLFSIFLSVSSLGIAQDSLFSKVYASSNYRYLVKAQAKDEYGNIAHVGLADFNNATYTYLDSLGNVLFSKEYSWTNGSSSALQFRNVKSTSDGNFIAVGDYFAPGDGSNYGVCAKIDSTGDLLWSAAVVPFNPIFFQCMDVIESMENTFWVSGYDSQSGEISLLEIDQNGTQLQSYSFSAAGFRLENRAILELDTNQLILVGNQLDQGGNASGHLLSIDKTGNILWSKTYGSLSFYAAQNDTNSIWVASANAGKMAISTIAHDGSAVNAVGYDAYLQDAQSFGFARLQDSTLAYCNGSNFESNLIVTRANSTNALWSHPWIKSVSLIPSSHGGLYLGGNGPMYGVKSMNNQYDHSGMIRMDSMLNSSGANTCLYPPNLSTIINIPFSASSLTLTSTQASSVTPGSLAAVDQTLTSYIGCVDFYGGLNELDENNLTIFPNPSSDMIQLQFETAVYGTLEICSMDGKLVQQANVSNNTTSISVAKLLAGTYLYRFTSSNNAVSRGKLIIE